jgi:diguanylate cyclase
VGIAVFPQDGRDLDTLLRHAKTALTQARRLGGNNLQYFHGLDESPGFDVDYLETGLRHALQHNELTLHFQPLIDTRSRQLRAGEALLRWAHVELGLLPFRRFIGAVSDPALLASLGDWVLEHACRAALSWPAQGTQPALRVTVNITIEQLMHGNFAERVFRALNLTGLPAERLELDLDENVLAEESAGIADTLNTLAQRGVRLAVDDFGRGLSSIPRPKRYPLKALKLDPSLVRGVGKSEESEAIVEAISCMATTLGLEVFARGVEDHAQQAFLRALDCHLQQGPLFGRPMPADDFARYLTLPTQ